MKVFYYSFASLSTYYIVDDGGLVMVSKTPFITKNSQRSTVSEKEVLALADTGHFAPHNLKAAVALKEYRDTNRKKRNISLTILGLGVAVMVLSILNGWWL